MHKAGEHAIIYLLIEELLRPAGRRTGRMQAGITERMISMGFIEETIVKAKEVFDVAGRKTSEAITIQKLKVNAASLDAQIAKDYEALGRLVYAGSREKSENQEATEELMAEIDAKRLQLESLQAEIAHMKGNLICSGCGASNMPGAVFCSKCGKKLQNTQKKQDDAPAAEEPADAE